MRTITLIVFYHISNDVEQYLIPEIEKVLGFSLEDHRIIPDEQGVYNVIYWKDVIVANDFQPSSVKRNFHNLVSNSRMSIVEHKRSWGEKWGTLLGIGCAIFAAIMTTVAVYVAFNPPKPSP